MISASNDGIPPISLYIPESDTCRDLMDSSAEVRLNATLAFQVGNMKLPPPAVMIKMVSDLKFQVPTMIVVWLDKLNVTLLPTGKGFREAMIDSPQTGSGERKQYSYSVVSCFVLPQNPRDND